MTDMIEDFEELREAARSLEFHMPGWTVSWRDPSDRDGYRRAPYDLRQALLVLTCKTVDTYGYFPGDEHNPNKKITVQHVASLILPIGRDFLPEWFRRQVHAALMHEADEWIRVDGWMRFNPHGDPKHLPVPKPVGPMVAGYHGNYDFRDDFYSPFR